LAAKAAAQPTQWARYKVQPSFVLAFHGCDETIAERVLAGKEHLKPSRKPYDWLGNGIYFWESSPQRALEWAHEAAQNPVKTAGNITRPAVVGAILDLGVCCNLFDSSALSEMATSYELLAWSLERAKTVMPKNVMGPDKVLRNLDCAVIEYMHGVRQDQTLLPYDTVRAAFGEGDKLYPDAGLTARNHIQISVRNTACIKGYFRPLEV